MLCDLASMVTLTSVQGLVVTWVVQPGCAHQLCDLVQSLKATFSLSVRGEDQKREMFRSIPSILSSLVLCSDLNFCDSQTNFYKWQTDNLTYQVRKPAIKYVLKYTWKRILLHSVCACVYVCVYLYVQMYTCTCKDPLLSDKDLKAYLFMENLVCCICGSIHALKLMNSLSYNDCHTFVWVKLLYIGILRTLVS